MKAYSSYRVDGRREGGREMVQDGFPKKLLLEKERRRDRTNKRDESPSYIK